MYVSAILEHFSDGEIGPGSSVAFKACESIRVHVVGGDQTKKA